MVVSPVRWKFSCLFHVKQVQEVGLFGGYLFLPTLLDCFGQYDLVDFVEGHGERACSGLAGQEFHGHSTNHCYVNFGSWGMFRKRV